MTALVMKTKVNSWGDFYKNCPTSAAITHATTVQSVCLFGTNDDDQQCQITMLHNKTLLKKIEN